MRYRQTQKIQLNKNKIFKTIFERAQRKTPIFQIHVWAVEALLIFLICNLAAKVLPFFPYLTSKTTKFLFFSDLKAIFFNNFASPSLKKSGDIFCIQDHKRIYNCSEKGRLCFKNIFSYAMFINYMTVPNEPMTKHFEGNL